MNVPMLPKRQNEDNCGVVQNCFAGHSFISGVDWKKIFPINLRRPKLSRQPYILFNLEGFSNLFPVHVEICVTLRAKKIQFTRFPRHIDMVEVSVMDHYWPARQYYVSQRWIFPWIFQVHRKNFKNKTYLNIASDHAFYLALYVFCGWIAW